MACIYDILKHLHLCACAKYLDWYNTMGNSEIQLIKYFPSQQLQKPAKGSKCQSHILRGLHMGLYMGLESHLLIANYHIVHTHQMGFEATISPSTLFLYGKDVLFELELIGMVSKSCLITKTNQIADG